MTTIERLRALLAERDALREALKDVEAEHCADTHPEYAGWYGEEGERPDLACQTCGTFDEYAVHWPCDTAKIARAALEGGSRMTDPRWTLMSDLGWETAEREEFEAEIARQRRIEEAARELMDQLDREQLAWMDHPKLDKAHETLRAALEVTA